VFLTCSREKPGCRGSEECLCERRMKRTRESRRTWSMRASAQCVVRMETWWSVPRVRHHFISTVMTLRYDTFQGKAVPSSKGFNFMSCCNSMHCSLHGIGRCFGMSSDSCPKDNTHAHFRFYVG